MTQEPELRTAGPLRVAGFVTRTSNPDELSGAGRIGALWQTFHQRAGEFPESPCPIAVYHDYESDHLGPYSLLVGCPAPEGASAPEGAEVIEVPRAEYMVFLVPEGEMPFTLIATWQRIWDYFEEDGPYRRTFTRDFEQYGDTIEVHVAVAARS